jgi:prepilin-type N-terminal cleavage/methylation domain-containing protein
MMQKNGFSILELLIVIAIMGILSAVIVPNLQRRTPRYEREQFITRFNSLVLLAWQQAITTYTNHRVSIDFEKNRIQVFVEQKDSLSSRSVYVPLSLGTTSTLEIPGTIVFKQCIIEGVDELKRGEGKKTAEVWFYVIPDGRTQSVIINAVDTKDMHNNKPRPFSLVLNPFSAQFETYDSFQK